MEASLTCAVCLGVFRDPVTLPQCSHNFCKSCVAECAEPASRLFPASTTSVSVPCPLCRKVSQVYGGPSQLPINTTLAELARLLSPSGGATTQEKPLQSPALAGHCSDHPEHRLELFCKNCSRACCGKCVSAAHHGIFHSVNLLDMVYQEEKLMFFNSLKKLREMYEKVTKEGLDEDYDVKNILQNNTDMVNAAFDEMQKALDLKRQHLLDFIKQQESETLKRQEVWKRTTAHHKITLQHLLRDSEAIVNEVEPECFLKVACSLNQRMKSHLDLMDLTGSNCHDRPKAELHRVDLKPVIDAISDLKMTAANDPLPNGNGDVSFKTLNRLWETEAPTQKFNPVQNQELCYLQGQLQKLTIRLFSITEMPEYRHLSFEELRMKYYENSVIRENDGASVTEQAAAMVKDNPHFRMKGARIKTPAGLNWRYSGCKPKPEISPKSPFKKDPGQNDGPLPSLFMFPKAVEVCDKEPTNCFLRGATGGLTADVNDDKETKAIEKVYPSVAPAFCLGWSDSNALSKQCKNERTWKKPKTAALPTSSVTFQSNFKPIFTFSNLGHSNENKDLAPFCNPFTPQDPKENKVSGDLVAQANCNEEFYDAVSNANSDAEEPEETNASDNAG